MTDDGGVDDPRDGRGAARTFHLRLGKAPVLDEILQPAHELADAQRDPVEVAGALQEGGAREDATEEDQPHQGATLLHIVDHAAD